MYTIIVLVCIRFLHLNIFCIRFDVELYTETFLDYVFIQSSCCERHSYL